MRPPAPLLATLALAAGLALAPTATAAPEPNPKATEHTTTAARQAAEVALTRAQAVFDGTASAADGREATIVFNELRKQMDSLSADDRAAARQILARPAASKKKCGTNVCVHWVTSGEDAPDLTDANGNGTPDYVDVMLKTFQSVHKTYVNAGYRAPLKDGTKGGNSKTDIYIEDMPYYGYCTSDQSKPSDGSKGWNVWAYCALDNDYAGFPATPLLNIRVTAAHEYFHAVQFAYDGWEDSWIMEATATWAEDELYDAVNDNLQYLPDGQAGHPELALDTWINGELVQYGNWLYFRHLTEKFTARAGGMPTLVRDVWRRLDGKLGAPDDYSLQGLNRILTNKGTSVKATLGTFAVANRNPAASYEEGASYPTAPATNVSVTTGAPDPAAFSATMDHLTTSTVRYDVSTLPANYSLQLAFNLADTARGSRALVTVIRDDNSRTTSVVTLNTSGGGSKSVSMASGTVAAVEVTLINGSGRFTCWSGSNSPAYSCGGVPKDDNLAQSVDPVAVAG